MDRIAAAQQVYSSGGRALKLARGNFLLLALLNAILVSVVSWQAQANAAGLVNKANRLNPGRLPRQAPLEEEEREPNGLEGARESRLVGQTSALQYLQRYGYLGGNGGGIDATTNNLISEDSFTEAIRSFQRFANIPETGLMDELTQSYMRLPRCGNTDRQNETSSEQVPVARLGWPALRRSRRLGGGARRRKRYALQGSKWRRQELTYRISQYPSRFNGKRHEVDAQIEKAFGIWSQVAPINFVVKREGRVHIDIRFASGDHGDGDAFDGPGNTLAHAYFPQYGGDAHFDDQELWTIDSYAGTNIFQVAAHELGHSLGLGHSNVREALMAPFYQKYKPHFKLHLDDVLAIQALYGEKPLFMPGEPPKTTATPQTTTTTTSSTTTPAPPTTGYHQPPARKPEVFENPPEVPEVLTNGLEGAGSGGPRQSADLCSDAMIDAVTRTEDGSSYVFKGDHYWLLTSEGLARGYPRRISADWEGLPGNLDAALTWADGKTFFFKGNKYWRFKNKRRDLGYPKLISSGFAGIPNDLDAAFVWSGNGRTYFFKGAEYWRFDSKAEPPVGSEYPRSIRIWNGVPAHINAAFKWENNVTYFFKGQQYYRFNDREFKIEARGRPAFPRNSAEWWFGCTGSNALAAQRAHSPTGSLHSELELTLARTPSESQPELLPEQATTGNEWSFFSGFDSQLEQQNKIFGTHISDHQKPPAAGSRQTQEAVGERGHETQDARQFYHKIGLSSGRHKEASNSSSAINKLSLLILLAFASLSLAASARTSRVKL